MHYNKIRKMDISNGPGIRVSIFMQGCTFNCKNCFNKETHDFNAGLEFDDNVIEKILDLSKSEHIKGLSILGGEPLHKKNILGTTKLAKEFRSKYPNKTIWVWTGNLYDDIKDYEIFNYIDVLVDGRYVDELHDFTLDYRGSSNQRVIDVLKSRESNDIVLYSKDEVKC
ncbi:MAG: anaerobic ribonucleoside-triphosphate reductase activating protein [Bacilli bacterium]|nr:anaerobic ribonucleoside-triphosphate reductase activating protein [Bacilli bacterium]